MGSDMNILAANSGGGAMNLVLLLAIPVVFYFLLIRPQSKRRREQQQMQSSVQPGVRVMTTSGMYGTVTAVDDDGLTLEIAPGVEARFVKQAVMNVIKDDVEDIEDIDDDERQESVSDHDEAVDLGKKDDGAAARAADQAEQKADKPSA